MSGGYSRSGELPLVLRSEDGVHTTLRRARDVSACVIRRQKITEVCMGRIVMAGWSPVTLGFILPVGPHASHVSMAFYDANVADL